MALGQNAKSDSDSGASWGGLLRPFTPKRRRITEGRATAHAKQKAVALAQRRARGKTARKSRKRNR